MNFIKSFNKLEKYTKYSIYIIILFSIIVLSLTSFYHVSGDGCWHIQAGKFIGKNFWIPLLEPIGRDEPFWSPPLYHIIVALVYHLFSAFNNNIADFAIKFISPIFGVLSLIFSFLVIKKLFNTRIAFYSLLFLASIPIFIDYSILSYVEMTLVFFIVLSIYFLIINRVVLAGIAVGLSILTKYNGIFIIPVLVCMLYHYYKKSSDKNQGKISKRLLYRNALIIILLPLVISSPWFVRNWILLGNPVWPFLNFFFHGLELKSYTNLNFLNLINQDLFKATYFGIFGVPDGNYSLFSFFNIPYFWFLFSIWLVGTLLFLMPLLIWALNYRKYMKDYPQIKFLVLWCLSYLLLFFLYVINVGVLVSRIILPIFPALAIFWALGLQKIIGDKPNKNLRIAKIAFVIIFAIVIGFIFTEAIKVIVASKSWNFYKQDFDWVKFNTHADAIFVVNGQCIPYNIERKSLYFNKDNLSKADYLWLNQKFRLDRISILDANTIRLIESKNYRIVYKNKETGTVIYKTSK